MNLQTGKHWPYRKPNSQIKYINVKSNHPPSVLKQVPQSIANRLSTLSSDKNAFDNAKPPMRRP